MALLTHVLSFVPYQCVRYASLYFCCAVEDQDNELITLEIIHRYVELLDKYFGSVSFLKITNCICNMLIVVEKFETNPHFSVRIASPDLLLFAVLCPLRCASWILSSTLKRPTSSWMSSCWVERPRKHPRRTCWRPSSRPTCCRRYTQFFIKRELS